MKKLMATGSLDPAANEPRNVILVGHAIGGDLYNLPSRIKESSGISAHPKLPIFDTQHLAREGNDPRALGGVLKERRIPFGYLHSGENDAIFILKALLIIAVSRCKDLELSQQEEDRKMLLQAVAQMKLPHHRPRATRQHLALEMADPPFAFKKQDTNWYDDCENGVSWVHCLDDSVDSNVGRPVSIVRND